MSEFWDVRSGDIRVMVQADKMPLNRAGVDRAGVAVNITCFQCVFKQLLLYFSVNQSPICAL